MRNQGADFKSAIPGVEGDLLLWNKPSGLSFDLLLDLFLTHSFGRKADRKLAIPGDSRSEFFC